MGSTRRKMTGQVLIRMDEGTRRSLEEVAEGKAVASYVRELLGQHLLDLLGVDPRTVEERQIMEARDTFIPPADLAEITALADKVSRLNGAVVQMTKSVREAGAESLHADCEAVLSDLRALRRELGDEVDYIRQKARGR